MFSRALFIALFMLAPLPALAQEKESAADNKPAVDWVTVESAGSISGAKSGAFERTLWNGQKRTDIESLIGMLPDRQGLRSLLNMQRRVLLTRADSSLIENDIGPLRGNDLFIQRIRKLMDMGLYDDAWSLYTQKAEEPYDVSIAELGMLLLIMRNDMATACLEEKVFAAKYPEEKFFKLVDAACTETIGAGKTPDFPDNAILQSIYHDAGYRVGAANPQVLDKMGDLERSLILANGKINYDGLTPEILRKTPSDLLGLYLMDKKLPESAKKMVKAETDKRGMSWHISSVAVDPTWKKAKDVGKDKEAQWPLLESAMKQISNPADLGPYVGMLADAEPANLSTDILVKALGGFLAATKPLPPYWLNAAQKRAAEKPLIYIYLQAFESLTASPDAAVSLENLQKALESLKPEDSAQILAIIETLDKNSENLNNLIQIYEKHSVLTLEASYVMPSHELDTLLETAPAKKQLGITVLAVLNSLAANPDNMYSGSIGKALKSLLNVGLIEDARQIGAETIAGVLNKY